MFDIKPIVDAIVSQLTPVITDAVITRLKAEGTGTLALEPGALEVPFAELLDGDSHAVDKLKAMAREEARDVCDDRDDSQITDMVHNSARDYLRENIDDAIERALYDTDFVRSRDVEDNVDLDNFDAFTELRDDVEELKTRANYSPYDENEYLKPEFVTAVRDALQRIINP